MRRLLAQRFGDGAVDIAAITPEHVRRFFAQQSKLYSKPVNTGTVTAALRGYFRYRITRGDAVHGLVGAVSYPANWQLSSLPKALTVEEVEQLTDSLRQRGRFGWRADAMVRCALDLGLRSSEIAKLSLDDIDWRAGTITLRRHQEPARGRAALPAATGEAIAAYLKHERPKTHQPGGVRAPACATRRSHRSRRRAQNDPPGLCTRRIVRTPARICYATRWPADCWTAAARSRRWPMCCATAR